jgi:hypothetical protein
MRLPLLENIVNIVNISTRDLTRRARTGGRKGARRGAKSGARLTYMSGKLTPTENAVTTHACQERTHNPCPPRKQSQCTPSKKLSQPTFAEKTLATHNYVN